MWIEDGFVIRFAPRLLETTTAKSPHEWLTRFEGQKLICQSVFTPRVLSKKTGGPKAKPRPLNSCDVDNGESRFEAKHQFFVATIPVIFASMLRVHNFQPSPPLYFGEKPIDAI